MFSKGESYGYGELRVQENTNYLVLSSYTNAITL